MALDINYTTMNPRNVDKILEGAIEEIQAGAAGKVFTPDVTDAQRSGTVDATVATIPPTIGTWVVGDKLYNSAPAASGFIGSVCVTAGTPGVHKTWGAISA